MHADHGRYKRYKHLFLILVGRLGQFLLMLAMMRVATTLLSPGEMGRMSLVMATIAFFALFLVNPVGMFVNRRLHAWRASGRAWHYLNRYWGYLGLVAVLAAATLAVLNAFRAVGFEITTSWLLLLVCGSILFNTMNQTVIPSLNLLGYSGWFVLLTVATVAVGFGCAMLSVWFWAPAAEYWLLGVLLGQAVFAAVGGWVLFTRLQESGIALSLPAIGKRQLRILFSYAWPIAIAVGLGWVQSQSYRYLMESILGLAPLGLFVAGYGLSVGLIAGFESVLTAYFQPRFYRDISTDHSGRQAAAWERYVAAVIPALALTTACVVALAPELTRIFLGPAFRSASEYVVWGAFAEAARVLIGTYSLIAHARMQTQWLLLPNFAGAVFSVVLCWWLIPLYGPAGVGIGLTLAGFLAVTIMHMLLGNIIAVSVPLRQVFVAAGLGAAVWGLAAVGRQLTMGIPEWMGSLGVVALAGATYIALQCLLLRGHLKDSESK